jgi:hypothetical protein
VAAREREVASGRPHGAGRARAAEAAEAAPKEAPEEAEALERAPKAEDEEEFELIIETITLFVRIEFNVTNKVMFVHLLRGCEPS